MFYYGPFQLRTQVLWGHLYKDQFNLDGYQIDPGWLCSHSHSLRSFQIGFVHTRYDQSQTCLSQTRFAFKSSHSDRF